MATKTDHRIVLSAQDNTKTAIRSLQSSLDRVRGSVFSLTSAVGILAGGAGFGALARGALDTVDALAKASRRIGTTTEDLAGLSLAARLGGIDQQILVKGLEGLAKRSSEAAIGIGTGKRALDELNISAQEFNSLPMSDRVAILADRFSTMTNEADRVRLAMDLFGRSGVEMINMLEGGSAGIRQARKDAEDLGLTIDKTRASAIESFNDSVTKLQDAIKGAFIQAMGDAAPQMEVLSNQIREAMIPAIKGLLAGFQWFLDNMEAVNALFKAFLSYLVVTRVVAFTQAIIGLTGSLVALQAAAATVITPLRLIALGSAGIAGITTYFSDSADEAEDLQKKIKVLDDQIESMNGTIFDLQNLELTPGIQSSLRDDKIQQTKQRIEELKKTRESMIQSLKLLQEEEKTTSVETTKAVEQQKKAVDQLSGSMDRLQSFTSLVNEELRETIPNFYELANVAEFQPKNDPLAYLKERAEALKLSLDPMLEYQNALRDLQAMEANNLITSTQYTEAVKRLREMFIETAEEVKKSTRVFDEQKTIFDRIRIGIDQLGESAEDIQSRFNRGVADAFDNASDALTNFIMGTEGAKLSFSDMARSIVADMIKMQIQQSIMQPLFGAISTGLGMFGTAATYGTNPSSQQTAMLSAQDAGLRANGGPVTRNRPYIVGEKGPELMIPNGSGRVMDNKEMTSGGSNVNVTLNISTGVSQTVRAEIVNLLPQITNAAKAAVADARQRGGSYSKALAGI